MIPRILLVIMLLLPIEANADDSASGPRLKQVTTRLGLLYVPIGMIKYLNDDRTAEIYDNLSYRVSAEYYLSDIFSIGPGAEYYSKHIDPYGSYTNENVSMYSLYLDFRINHGLTDSGGSYLVFGAGSGVSSLSEEERKSGAGFSFYVLTGLDIAVHKSIGFDLLYRYQTTRITIDEKSFRFERSAIQSGLNYRFKF
jgi:opacity protein-like surface antigen